MKTNYHPRNKNKHTNLYRIAVILVVFILLYFFLSSVRVPLVSMVTPLWRSGDEATSIFANTISVLQSKNSLIKENQELKSKILSYEAERASFLNWQNREIEIFNLLGRKADNVGIIASVLSSPPQSPYDTLVVDIGGDSGVVVGQSVRMPEGAILGYVSETYGNNSKIKLLTTSGEETSAVLERNGTVVQLIGAGGGMFEFSVPRDTEIQQGDRIVSSDLHARLVGIVGDISMRPTDAFKEALAQSPVNIFNIRYVLITQ